MIVDPPSGISPDRIVSATPQRRQRTTSAVSSPTGVRPLALGVLLAVLALVVAHAFFPQFYQTNDDPGMDLTARGTASTPAEPHLLFINILIGQLLAALYTHAPDLPWYRLFMLALQVVSATVIYSVMLARGASRPKLLLAALYLVVFDLYFYTNPQFTITAAVAAQAAVMLWLEAADRGQPLGPARLALFLGLIACSAMVRESSCLMMLFLAMPAVAVLLAGRFLRTAEATAPPRRLVPALNACVLPFALGSALAVSLAWYNNHVYRSQPEWREFYRYNALKSLIIDTDQIRYTPKSKWVFDQVGWSQNDFEMFKTFAYFGDDTFALHRLERLVELYRKVPAEPTAAPSPDSKFNRPPTVLEVFASKRMGAPARAAILLVPMLFLPWRRDRLTLVFLTLAAVIILVFYLFFYMNRCPHRVSDPILAYFAGLAIFAAEATPARRTYLRVLRALGCCAAVGLTLAYLWDQHAAWDDNYSARADFDQELARLQPVRDQLLVDWRGALPLELLPPLGSWERIQSFQALSVGTGTRTPPTRRLLRRFHVRDFFRDIYTRDDIIVIASPSVVQCLVRFANEHYHEKVVIRTIHPVFSQAVDGIHTLFCLYTLGKKEPRASSLPARSLPWDSESCERF